MTMWGFMPIYRTIINYIDKGLRDKPYSLNFSIIATSTVTPRVLVRFTLTSHITESQVKWTTILYAETVSQLYNAVEHTVNIRLPDTVLTA